MKNDAAPWDRLIWTDHELDWLEEVFAGGFLLPGDLLWILKIDTTGTDSWNIKCLAWIIGRLFFVFLLPISRGESFSKDGNYSEILESRIEENVGSLEKKKKKKVYSVKSSHCFRPTVISALPVPRISYKTIQCPNITKKISRLRRIVTTSGPFIGRPSQGTRLVIIRWWRASRTLTGRTLVGRNNAAFQPRTGPSRRRSRRRSSSSKIETEDRVVPV